MGRGNLGEFERCVMFAVLRLGDNAYGVTVRDEIEKRIGRSSSYGAVYTTLDRLQDKGFVTSRMGEPTDERGGRRKRFFALTGKGQTALSEAEAAHARMKAGVKLLTRPATQGA